MLDVITVGAALVVFIFLWQAKTSRFLQRTFLRLSDARPNSKP